MPLPPHASSVLNTPSYHPKRRKYPAKMSPCRCICRPDHPLSSPLTYTALDSNRSALLRGSCRHAVARATTLDFRVGVLRAQPTPLPRGRTGTAAGGSGGELLPPPSALTEPTPPPAKSRCRVHLSGGRSLKFRTMKLWRTVRQETRGGKANSSAGGWMMLPHRGLTIVLPFQEVRARTPELRLQVFRRENACCAPHSSCLTLHYLPLTISLVGSG